LKYFEIELNPGLGSLRSTGMLALPVTLFDALATPVRPRRRRSAPPPGPRTVQGMTGDGDDDAALMQAWMAGDLRAFEALYARHKGPLYRYLLRHTRQRELADDLFQETWGRLIGARQRYEPRAKFQTFLFTLAHNLFIDHCRRASVRPVSASSLPAAPAGDDDDSQDERGIGAIRAPEPEQPERRAEEHETAARIRAALETLPREQRDVFLLYEETGLTLEEIGKVTGVGAETAKSRLRYAVAKLRAAMSDLAPATLERSP
jgi:RNA polymerase sigma-70 factor, ECF subfamily